MFFLLKATLRTLLLPPGSALLLATAGAVLVFRRRRLGLTLLAVGLGSIWLLALPVVADVLTRAAEGYPPLDPRAPVSAQAVVILSGGGYRQFAPEYGGGAASDVLLERLTYGAFLAKRLNLPVLVTGDFSEIGAMADTLRRDFGVEPTWVDRHSHDTYENARISHQLLHPAGIHRILLVTSATHMRRAVHEFAAAGFDVVPAPTDCWMPRPWTVLMIVPSASGLLQSQVAIYELAGEAVRRVLAWTRVREWLGVYPAQAGPLAGSARFG
jgi:uncharacterized SAM-binding protein YcdF (DUF218 family)